MTCRHVLDQIDAETVVDERLDLLSAVPVHALTCPTCAVALGVSRDTPARLRALATVSAPPAFQTSVMARIARLEDAAPITAHEPASADWKLWPAAACLVLGILLIALALSLSPVGPRPWHMRISPAATTQSLATVAALLVGLVCYAIGLFTPIARRRRS